MKLIIFNILVWFEIEIAFNRKLHTIYVKLAAFTGNDIYLIIDKISYNKLATRIAKKMWLKWIR